MDFDNFFPSTNVWTKRVIFFAKYSNKHVKDYAFANIGSIDMSDRLR